MLCTKKEDTGIHMFNALYMYNSNWLTSTTQVNIATLFYKYKNPFVTHRTWTQKTQNVSLEKNCANIKWQCSCDTFSLVTSLGNTLGTQKYDAPVTRFSSRKLHFDKILSPHPHLPYPSVCLLVR